jgi:hypothetical protein
MGYTIGIETTLRTAPSAKNAALFSPMNRPPIFTQPVTQIRPAMSVSDMLNKMAAKDAEIERLKKEVAGFILIVDPSRKIEARPMDKTSVHDYHRQRDEIKMLRAALIEVRKILMDDSNPLHAIESALVPLDFALNQSK